MTVTDMTDWGAFHKIPYYRSIGDFPKMGVDRSYVSSRAERLVHGLVRDIGPALLM